LKNVTLLSLGMIAANSKSIGEIAEKCGTSSQNLNQWLKRKKIVVEPIGFMIKEKKQ